MLDSAMFNRQMSTVFVSVIFSKMAKQLGRRPVRALNEEQIKHLLDNSDFEDSDEDDVFIPELEENSNTDSTSSSESEDEVTEVGVSRGRGSSRQVRSARGQRGGHCRGRGKTNTNTRRNQSTRASSARSSPSFEQPNTISQDAAWHENNDMKFINSPLMQPDYLPISLDESNFFRSFLTFFL
ncbi:hypothetical protein ACJJTC_007160 [Scirpophaga incertulas]